MARSYRDPDDERKARQLFAALDRDHSGVLQAEELAQAMRAHGIAVSPAAVAQFRRRLCGQHAREDDVDAAERTWLSRKSQGGKPDPLDVSEQDFVHFYCQQVALLREAYRLLTLAGGGRLGTSTINATGLRLAARMLGFRTSVLDVDRMLRAMDEDGDGQISFDEFVSFMLLLPQSNVQALFDSFEGNTMVEPPHPEWSPHYGFFVVNMHEQGHGHRSEASIVASHLLAGAIAGMVSRTCTAPIDRVRLLLQAKPATAALSAPSAKAVERSSLQVIRSVLQTEGPLGFWRGNGANVLKVAPECAVRFASFSFFCQHLARDQHNITPSERFLAGGLAGVLSQTIIYPLEVTRTCMSVAPRGTYSGIWDCAASIVRSSGIRALFAGWTLTTAGVFPYAGLDLAMNSILRDQVERYYSQRDAEPGVVTMLGCGIVRSTFATVCTYPIGLLRTKLQAQQVPGALQFEGLRDCAVQTFQAGGLRAFYRGIVPTIIKVWPSATLSYAIFATTTRWIDGGRSHRHWHPVAAD